MNRLSSGHQHGGVKLEAGRRKAAIPIRVAGTEAFHDFPAMPILGVPMVRTGVAPTREWILPSIRQPMRPMRRDPRPRLQRSPEHPQRGRACRAAKHAWRRYKMQSSRGRGMHPSTKCGLYRRSHALRAGPPGALAPGGSQRREPDHHMLLGIGVHLFGWSKCPLPWLCGFAPDGGEARYRAVSRIRKNTMARARDATSMYGSRSRMVSASVGALRMPVMISAVQWALGACFHGLRRLVSMISCIVPLFFAMIVPFWRSAAHPCLQCVRTGRACAARQRSSHSPCEASDTDAEWNAYHAVGGRAHEPLGPFVAGASPGAER